MEENLLALLEKSRLFSPYIHGRKARVKIEGMKDFRFFLCNCFFENNSEELSYFKRSLKNFLKRYIGTWTEILDKNPEKEFDWKEHSQKVFSFFEDFNWKKIFDEVKSGEKHTDLDIKANGSIIRIKRFGNILGFNILNQRYDRKEHFTGLRAIKTLCRAEDPNNNQGVYEIVHKVKVCFSIPGENPRDGKYIFDFEQIFKLLQTALPWVKWSLNTGKLIEAYLCNSQENLVVGQYCGFNIHAELINDKKNLENFQKHEVTILRRGNIEKIQDCVYQFADGDDILFKLVLKSSLPDTSFQKINMDFDFHREQFKITEVAAIFCVQLCSMQLNKGSSLSMVGKYI